MAGDLPGFEEASRALFAGDRARFAQKAADWPTDIGAYADKLALPGWPADGPDGRGTERGDAVQGRA